MNREKRSTELPRQCDFSQTTEIGNIIKLNDPLYIHCVPIVYLLYTYCLSIIYPLLSVIVDKLTVKKIPHDLFILNGSVKKISFLMLPFFKYIKSCL